MGANNGKFYDVGKSNLLFSDFEAACDIYIKSADIHCDELMNYSVTDCFKGLEAIKSKELISKNQIELMSAVLTLQNDAIQLQQAIDEKFRSEVDSATDARIDYDTLEKINADFETFYINFKSTSDSAENQAKADNANFSKYGYITLVDFSDEKSKYIDLCGGLNSKEGYVYECMQKLVKFDAEALELIENSNLKAKTENLRDLIQKKNVLKDTKFVKNVKLIDKIEAISLKEELTFEDVDSVLDEFFATLFPNEYNRNLSFVCNTDSWLNTALGSLASPGIVTRYLNEFLNEEKEEHYNRNQYNVVPENIDEICTITYDSAGNPIVEGANGWVKMSDGMSAYHKMPFGEQGESAVYNYKFCYANEDGTSYEVVINIPPKKEGDPEFVTDPYNAGTYNYSNPIEIGEAPIEEVISAGVKHFTEDMLPYWFWGNSPEDSSPKYFIYRVLGMENINKIEKLFSNVLGE